MMMRKRGYFVFLILGDAATILVVTVIGFATHDALGAPLLRILATFLPLCLGWFCVAPWLGLFDVSILHDWRQLWRVAWAMCLAAPLAAWLRGIWLRSVVLPLFVAILGGVSVLAMGLWRGIYGFICARRAEVHHG